MLERLFSKVAQTNCHQPYFYLRFSFSLTCLRFFSLSLLHYVITIEREIYNIIVKISFSFQNRQCHFQMLGTKIIKPQKYIKNIKRKHETSSPYSSPKAPFVNRGISEKILSTMNSLMFFSVNIGFTFSSQRKISLIHLL